MIEVKDAYKTHGLKGSELETLFRRAARQGKRAVYVVYFTEADITATLTINRGKQ